MKAVIGFTLLVAASAFFGAEPSHPYYDNKLCMKSISNTKVAYNKAASLWPIDKDFPESLKELSKTLNSMGDAVMDCLRSYPSPAVRNLKGAATIIEGLTVEISPENIYLNGQDITEELRNSVLEGPSDYEAPSDKKCIADLLLIGKDLIKIKEGNFSLLVLRSLIVTSKDIIHSCFHESLIKPL
mmetsp:Transcript_13436/g.25315  ORF Transcript_13436/g.25315 Transcript_13436/m.25315 type:complete len:185 (-) Transcript_13436:32-586(-)